MNKSGDISAHKQLHTDVIHSSISQPEVTKDTGRETQATLSSQVVRPKTQSQSQEHVPTVHTSPAVTRCSCDSSNTRSSYPNSEWSAAFIPTTNIV